MLYRNAPGENYLYKTDSTGALLSPGLAPGTLAFEQVHRLADVSDAEVFRQRGVALRDSFIHRVRHIAIREMSGCTGAQFADVNCLGQIHLEQRSLTEGQRDGVLRLPFRFLRPAGGELSDGGARGVHHRVVADG